MSGVQNTEEALLALGVGPESIPQLLNLIPLKARTLTILTCPDPLPGIQIAQTLANASLQIKNSTDIVVATSEGDRWTLNELDERVVRPSSIKPQERTHLIVDNAENMSRNAHDHLLKTVEEPGAEVAFYLIVQEDDQLPTTIRGRASNHLKVQPTDHTHLKEQLIKEGIQDEVADEVATISQGDLPLARSVIKQGQVPSLLKLSQTTWETRKPASHSEETLLTIAELAHGMGTSRKSISSKGSYPRLDNKTLDPITKTQVRRMLLRLVSRWQTELSYRIKDAKTPTELDHVENQLDALDTLKSDMRLNTPLPWALARALVTLNQ